MERLAPVCVLVMLNKHDIVTRSEFMAAGEFFGTPRVPLHADAHALFSMLVTGHYCERFGDEHWDARPLDIVLRRFKRQLGVTISQYLRALRLQDAARALLEHASHSP
jgi:hypothetical protein